MIDLVEARIQVAKDTAANALSVDIYSDGSLTNQINGLAHLIQTNGRGTVGGINSLANYTNWRNQFKEMSGTNTWSSSTILGEMNALWLNCVFGGNAGPHRGVARHLRGHEAALQQNQRYMDASSAAAGFETLKYKSASIIFDTNTNFGTTAERAYFLNTKYLFLVQHPKRSGRRMMRRSPSTRMRWSSRCTGWATCAAPIGAARASLIDAA